MCKYKQWGNSIKRNQLFFYKYGPQRGFSGALNDMLGI